jgi:hypothetical protein
VIVRELFARLGLQVDEAAFAAADAALGVVRKGLFGLAGVATAVAGGFAAAVGTMVAQGGRLDDLSKQVGVSTDALQTLGYAADQNGVSIDELAQSLQYIARQAYEASTGGKAQAEAFARAGIRIRTATGELKKGDDLLRELSGSLARLPEGAQRTGTAMDLLGRSGGRMVTLLGEGPEKLKELEERARALGTMDKETIAITDELGDSFSDVMRVLGDFRNSLALPLLAPLRDLTKAFVDWYMANRLIIRSGFKSFLSTVVAVVTALAQAVGFLVRHWRIFIAIAAGVAAAMLALKLAAIAQTSSLLFLTLGYIGMGAAAVAAAAKAAVAWVAATWPLVAIAAAVAAVILILEDLYYFFTGGESVIGEAVKKWGEPVSRFAGELWDTFKNFFTKVAEAGTKIFRGLFSFDIDRLEEGLAALTRVPGFGGVASTLTGFGAVGRGGEAVMSLAGFGGGASPAASVAAGGGGGRTVLIQPNVKADVKVTAAPGESAAETAQRTGEALEQVLATEKRDALKVTR